MSEAAKPLELSRGDRSTLESWVNEDSTPQQIALRAQLILCAADGVANSVIADELGITRPTVLQWRQRFEREGVDALTRIRPGRGRKPQINEAKIKAIIHDTLHSKPKDATHWSCRSMAKRHGVGATTIQKIWGAHGLQPHRVKRDHFENTTLACPHSPAEFTGAETRNGQAEHRRQRTDPATRFHKLTRKGARGASHL
jgi:hypothetical protein